MTRTAEPEELLTSAEAALILRVSPRTVSRWGDAGRLPIAARAGDVRLFRRPDVDRVAAELAEQAEQRAADLKAAAS